MKTNQEDLIETLETLFLYISDNYTRTENLTHINTYLELVKDTTEAAIDLIAKNREAGIIP